MRRADHFVLLREWLNCQIPPWNVGRHKYGLLFTCCWQQIFDEKKSVNSGNRLYSIQPGFLKQNFWLQFLVGAKGQRHRDRQARYLYIFWGVNRGCSLPKIEGWTQIPEYYPTSFYDNWYISIQHHHLVAYQDTEVQEGDLLYANMRAGDDI